MGSTQGGSCCAITPWVRSADQYVPDAMRFTGTWQVAACRFLAQGKLLSLCSLKHTQTRLWVQDVTRLSWVSPPKRSLRVNWKLKDKKALKAK